MLNNIPPAPDAEIAELIARLDAAEAQLRQTRRQIRATWTFGFIAAVGASVAGLNPAARAQVGVTPASLNARMSAVETKTQDMARLTDANTGQPTVRFSGVNVQVVSGSGSTEGAVNGRGNLIIGYNETGRGNLLDVRTGSHNLVVGRLNNYSSYGGLVSGYLNATTGKYSSVSGGTRSTASGEYSSVSGGQANRAIGDGCSVSGGTSNTANENNTSVSGGYQNTASGNFSSVSGGRDNTAGGSISSVSGGYKNTAGGNYSSASGGTERTTNSVFGWIAGTFLDR